MSEAKNNPNRLNVLTEFLRNCKLIEKSITKLNRVMIKIGKKLLVL